MECVSSAGTLNVMSLSKTLCPQIFTTTLTPSTSIFPQQLRVTPTLRSRGLRAALCADLLPIACRGTCAAIVGQAGGGERQIRAVPVLLLWACLSCVKWPKRARERGNTSAVGPTDFKQLCTRAPQHSQGGAGRRELHAGVRARGDGGRRHWARRWVRHCVLRQVRRRGRMRPGRGSARRVGPWCPCAASAAPGRRKGEGQGLAAAVKGRSKQEGGEGLLRLVLGLGVGLVIGLRGK